MPPVNLWSDPAAMQRLKELNSQQLRKQLAQASLFFAFNDYPNCPEYAKDASDKASYCQAHSPLPVHKPPNKQPQKHAAYQKI